MAAELAEYHRKQPLQRGMPREALRSRMSIESKLFNAVVEKAVEAGIFEEFGAVICLTGHVVAFNDEQEAAITTLMRQIEATPAAPPNPKEMIAMVGGDVLQALLDHGDLI